MFDFLRSKYDNVARICNFSILKPRSSIKAAARALGKPHSIINQLNKMIDPVNDFEFSLQKSEVGKFISDNNLEDVIKVAQQLNGLVDHYNVHAAAVVIAPYDMSRFAPLMYNEENPELPITQYDMHGCEDVGLVKYDFLSLSTLDVIQDTAKACGIRVEDVPAEAKEVYDFFASGQDLFGVFQFEKQMTQQICEGSKPQSLADLSAINAVIRPGALHSNFHIDYVKGEKNYSLPVLQEELRETKGILLYQEQLMSLSQKMAGLTEEQADDLRKGIGKKKHELIKYYHDVFVNGCIENGYMKEDAEDVWNWFDAAKDYAFNKSHSILYSLISYYCAWYRVHYPVEYFSAILNSYVDNREKLKEALRRIRKIGIKILLPDINKSDINFTAENGSIRFGFKAIKGIGEAVANNIVKMRNGNGFASLSSFKASKATTPNNTLVLVKAGCFDNIITSRNDAEQILARKNNTGLLFEEDRVNPESEEERGAMEKDLLGIFITKNPLGSFDAFTDGEYNILSDLLPSQIGTRVQICGIITDVKHKTSKSAIPKPYATCIIADPYEEIKGIVFAKTLPIVAEQLNNEGKPMIITGYLNIDTYESGEEDEIDRESADIFGRGQITILDLIPYGHNNQADNKIKMLIPDSITKDKLIKLSEFLKSCANENGKEVIVQFQDRVAKTQHKVRITESTELYLNRNYGIVIERIG